MTRPPKSMLLLLLLALVALSGCVTLRKDGKGLQINLLPASPLLIDPTPPTPAPPDPAPDETLYDPTFEDAAAIVDWARPVAPEGSFNTQFTPDGQTLLYLARHPGTRWTSLYSIPLAGGEPILLGTAEIEEEILFFTPTVDSQHVIYYQPFSYQEFKGNGLYSVTLSGTKQIRLTDDRISETAISPDGQWVVYWGENDKGESGLYSIPITGGTPVLLGDGLPQSESYKITPDSRYVLFVAARELGVEAPLELYRAPIQGGTTIQLSQAELARGNATFLITPDSQTVIFGNLYRVSIDGGPAEQLNPFFDIHRPYFPFSGAPQLSADGNWLLFLAGDPRGDGVSLYGVPLAGGPTRQLNGPLANGENVHGFFFSLDSQRVFYWQGGIELERVNTPLYALSLAGGDPITLPAWYWVQQSPDGRRLLYGTKLETPGFDLYSVSSAGGTPVQLNGPVPTNSAVAYAIISMDSRTVLYVTSKDADGGMYVFDGLYQVPMDGGEAREITGVDGRDRVFGFFFAPDGQTVLAGVDYDGDGRSALYAFATEAAPAPVE